MSPAGAAENHRPLAGKRLILNRKSPLCLAIFQQKALNMFLLDLFAAKAAFIVMVVLLVVIPVWIILVAFTKKKGKADSINAPDEVEEQTPEAV